MLASQKPRAVLDTNLVVRLLISPDGATGRLLPALAHGYFHLVISEPLLEELGVTLRYPRLQKFGPFRDHDVNRIQRILRHLATVVPGDYADFEKVPTDIEDNIVVACALEGGADYIVTDDRRDLLPLKVVRCAGWQPVQIVSPGDFLRMLNRVSATPR